MSLSVSRLVLTGSTIQHSAEKFGFHNRVIKSWWPWTLFHSKAHCPPRDVFPILYSLSTAGPCFPIQSAVKFFLPLYPLLNDSVMGKRTTSHSLATIYDLAVDFAGFQSSVMKDVFSNQWQSFYRPPRKCKVYNIASAISYRCRPQQIVQEMNRKPDHSVSLDIGQHNALQNFHPFLFAS